jgi:hypothetical protein
VEVAEPLCSAERDSGRSNQSGVERVEVARPVDGDEGAGTVAEMGGEQVGAQDRDRSGDLQRDALASLDWLHGGAEGWFASMDRRPPCALHLSRPARKRRTRASNGQVQATQAKRGRN